MLMSTTVMVLVMPWRWRTLGDADVSRGADDDAECTDDERAVVVVVVDDAWWACAV